MTARAHRGFTLIEMIVVIALSAIIAAVVARNIAQPIQGFVDTSRRAALVDAGDGAIRRVVRETRLALPNSVRVTSGNQALEFLRTRSGGRYRAEIDTTPLATSDILDFNIADTAFDVLGELRDFGQINGGGAGATTVACMADTTIDCLVIFNTGQPTNCAITGVVRSNAYCGDNVAGINAVNLAGRSISFVHDGGGFQLASPNQRFHIVDTPVSYLCDLANNRLLRYDGYPIAASQPSLAAPPSPATARTVADKVIGCSFDYDPGSAGRAALLSVRLELADDDAPDEQITLFQQAHIPNTP